MRKLLVAAAAVLAPLASAAQVEAQVESTVGTILVAHGGGPEWDEQVLDVASQVDTGGPVEVSFLMGPGAPTHRFQDAVARLTEQGASQIVVVPLLVSSHSGHYEQIRYLAGETDELSEQMKHHLHMAGIERADAAVPIEVTPAIDDAAEVAQVLADRALALAESPAEQALFLVGHGPNGPEDHAAWMQGLRHVAERVQELAGLKDVKIGLVRDDAPDAVRAEAVLSVRDVIELQYGATGRDVIVVPVLISSGRLSNERLPDDLAGLPIVYSGEPLLPHEGIARWVETRVRETGRVAAGQVDADRDDR